MKGDTRRVDYGSLRDRVGTQPCTWEGLGL